MNDLHFIKTVEQQKLQPQDHCGCWHDFPWPKLQVRLMGVSWIYLIMLRHVQIPISGTSCDSFQFGSAHSLLHAHGHFSVSSFSCTLYGKDYI